mmetsp:Transcript_40096/g.93112  ORF Transcript_40096/g.93112 Transcript_40096/m.93112 type:complete len:451 (+) Transcript_40096:73-1425(+)
MIDYQEDWVVRLLCKWDCKVTTRALVYAVPAAILAVLLCFGEQEFTEVVKASGLPEITDSSTTKKNQTFLALTFVLTLMIDFRTVQAFERFWEGTSLLHQMRGEWFDSISCLVTWTMGAVEKKPEKVCEFRHTIVRLMSVCHGSALEEIGDSEYKVVDWSGVDHETQDYLESCKDLRFNRVETVLHIIYTLITKAQDDGVLCIPPPIMTRVYQTLSRGYVSLLNAKKITATRFPFPYAQLISSLLMLHVVCLPGIIAMLFRNPIWSGVFTFVPVFGLFSLNFVASELENPFGRDDNHLPLYRFQKEMNSSLLMLLHGLADHVPTLSAKCNKDFDKLAASMHFVKNGSDQDLGSTVYSSSREEQEDGTQWNTLTAEIEEVPDATDVEKVRAEPALPTPAAKPEPAQADLAMKNLASSMVDFNRTLHKWTKTVEGQVGDLRRSFDAVKSASK